MEKTTRRLRKSPLSLVMGWGIGVFISVLLTSPLEAQALGEGAIQGRVWSDQGTPVGGVLVRISMPSDADFLRAVETDELGYFRLVGVSPGPYTLVTERMGYHTQSREVLVIPGAALEIDVTLETAPVEVPGISVEAERSRDRVRFEGEVGETVQELARSDIKSIPGLVEADPLRAVEVLPGVITTSDFSSAFNVRGGSADQNLILLDGIPVFNPTHLGGFFSVFNGDMIDGAELRSGGFPARFGGRVSSVLEVQTDPGDGTLHGDVGASFMATRLALGGGLPEVTREALGLRSARWRFSGRRSYFDQVLKPIFDFPYHLNDFQGIFQAWTEGGDRISLTAYTGKDVLDMKKLDSEDYPLRVDWSWGNDLFGGSWIHPRGDGGRFQLRGGYSRFSAGLGFPDFGNTDIQSLIRQWSAEGDLEVRPSSKLTLTVGGGLQDLQYDNLFTTGGTEVAGGNGAGKNLFGYAQSEWGTPGSWLVELGVRGDLWKPSVGMSNLVISPRFSAKRFFAGERWALKASAGRYAQFLQSIRDEELPIGLDIWVLAGAQAPHVVSDQVQVGLEGYPQEGLLISLEGYYRTFQGVSTTNPADNPNDVLDDFLAGTGTAHGVDFFVRKSIGATTGWVSMSWLKATRTFPDHLSGLDPAPEITYPPIFDRRFDVDLVIQQEMPWGLRAGIRWNFGTGLPFTRPQGSYAYLFPRVFPGLGQKWFQGNGGIMSHGVVLGDRNSARYPARHRLDLSLRWTFQNGWGRITPYLNILNVYDHRNVLYYFYDYEKTPPVRTGISMFPFLPTLGLEISF